jgi:hypothetical protein
MAPTTSRNDQDWLASLARQATSSDANKKNAKRKGGNDSKPTIRTKAERIQHRQEKKMKREERKHKLEEEKRARMAKKKQQQNESRTVSTSASSSRRKATNKESVHKGMTPSSKKALTQLSTTITSMLSHRESQPNSKRKSSDLINGLPALPKGKATKQSTINPHELQPRTRDYNGQGLARPSLFLALNDVTFIPRLEEEFAEHIPGFFGKSKTAGVKKQKGEEMLWRKRLEEKQREDGGKKKKKRTVDMI